MNKSKSRVFNFFGSTWKPEQRRKAILPFDANDRFRWHYVPIEMFPRQGLPLEEMQADQKQKAFSLLAASLSEKGYQKACSIINLENILGEIEQAEGTDKLTRDPERYYFTILVILQTESLGGGV